MDCLPDVTRFFHPVLAAAKLKQGPLRVTILDRPFVLFRDEAGRPAALVDRCPHRFAPLSAGRVRPDGRLACPYHGWHFDGKGQGQSPSQPGLQRCDVPALQVVDRLGTLFIAAPQVPLSAFPQALDEATQRREGMHFAGSFSALMPAPLHVALDNFSEAEHMPWVHTRLGWDQAQAGLIDYEAHNFPDRTEVRYSAPQRPSPLLRLLLIKDGDVFHNRWVTRFDPVHAQYTMEWTDPQGRPRPLITQTTIFMVPETATTTRFHLFIFVRLTEDRYRSLLPVIKRAVVAMGKREVRDDARLLPLLADTPLDLKGMRLGKYDKPIIHNRKLLRSLYLGEPAHGHEEDGPGLAQVLPLSLVRR